MRPHHVRIRLLGELEVLRDDGTSVSLEEWRTGKTIDLLNILALNNGRPVRQTSLIDRLWPNVTAEKARASLRTAGSRIRMATRVNCVIRQPGTVQLSVGWVDVHQFLADARRVQTACLAGRYRRALSLARAADRLYRDDFHAHDDESTWARTHREHLARSYHRMLCDAAEAALALGMYRDGLDIATTAVTMDRSSETAHRALMRAYAELGEIGSALRVFESYRAFLADELGADPSAQTQDLHLRLMRGNRP
jgi:DNA-binding SARP family transcriptional activator